MRRFIIYGVLSLAILAACYRWKRSDVPPRDLFTGTDAPSVVRVWRYVSDSAERQALRGTGESLLGLNVVGPLELRSIRLEGDSLVGLQVVSPAGRRSGAGPAEGSILRTAIALRDITNLEVRRLDGLQTGLAVVGVATAVLAVIALVAAVTFDAPSFGVGSWDAYCQGQYGCASCPLVYSWTDTGWRLDSGTFGGALARALQRTDLDNLDFATPEGRILRLRVTNELAETDHLDALGVLAVDHALGTVVAPDASGAVHVFRDPARPIAAQDFRGADELRRVRARDGYAWVSAVAGRDSSRAEDVRDGLVLKFVRPAGADVGHLVLDGHNTVWATQLLTEWLAARGPGLAAWYDSLESDPIHARRAFAPVAREGFLSARLLTRGGWRTAGQFWEAGPEILKRQVLHLDLSSVPGDTVIIRLESAPAFWRIDQVAMGFGEDEPAVSRELPLVKAVAAEGRDVRDLLGADDRRYLTLETGDRADLEFEAPESPLAARTYLLRSSGWYRIHAPAHATTDQALLTRVDREPLALSRIAVGRLNQLLATASASSP